MLQKFEQRVKGFLAASQAETGALEDNPDADGPRGAPVAQGKEDVLLPAVPHQKGAQRLPLEAGVGLLHRHGPPVESAGLQHGAGGSDEAEVLLVAEGAEVRGTLQVLGAWQGRGRGQGPGVGADLSAGQGVSRLTVASCCVSS